MHYLLPENFGECLDTPQRRLDLFERYKTEFVKLEAHAVYTRSHAKALIYALNLANLDQARDLLVGRSALGLKLLCSCYPDLAYQWTIGFDLLDDLSQIRASSDATEFVYQTVCGVVSSASLSFDLAKRQKGNPRFYIAFCDRYGFPANVIEILRAAEKRRVLLDDDDIAFALHINKARRNRLFLREALTLNIYTSASRELLGYLTTLASGHDGLELLPLIRRQLARSETDQGLSNLQKRLEYLGRSPDPADFELIFEMFSIEGESPNEFVARACSEPSPDLFNRIAMCEKVAARYERLHMLCMTRLKSFPDSLAVVPFLLAVFGKDNKGWLAVGLLERKMSKSFSHGDLIELAHQYAKLGVWALYERVLGTYLKYFEALGSNRPLFALAEMFYIDAAPTIQLADKLRIYSSLAEAKKLRQPVKHLRGPRTVGIFSGDIRRHAMKPYIDWVAEVLTELGVEATFYNTAPPTISDLETEKFGSRYNMERLPAFNQETHSYLLGKSHFLALDLSQHTEFNGLDYFRFGVAKRQISTWWPAGFSTGMSEFDGIILDEFAFENIKDGQFIEPIVRLTNTLSTGPTQVDTAQIIKKLELDATEEVRIGLFFRPMRLNEEYIAFLAKISLGNPRLFFYYAHPHLERPQTRLFLEQQFNTAGLPHGRLEMSSEPLFDAASKVHIAIDSFPACSPTTSKDLILNGLPVLSRFSEIPYSRFTSSFLKAMQLEFLCCDSEQAFMYKLSDTSAIRNKFFSIDLQRQLKLARDIGTASMKAYFARTLRV